MTLIHKNPNENPKPIEDDTGDAMSTEQADTIKLEEKKSGGTGKKGEQSGKEGNIAAF